METKDINFKSLKIIEAGKMEECLRQIGQEVYFTGGKITQLVAVNKPLI